MKSSILLHPARHADHGIHRFLSWIHHWLDLTRDIAIILFHLEPLIMAHRTVRTRPVSGTHPLRPNGPETHHTIRKTSGGFDQLQSTSQRTTRYASATRLMDLIYYVILSSDAVLLFSDPLVLKKWYTLIKNML